MNDSVDDDGAVTSEEVEVYGQARMGHVNRSNLGDCPSDLLPSIPAYLSGRPRKKTRKIVRVELPIDSSCIVDFDRFFNEVLKLLDKYHS